jgi:large subunit ribosomal protein L22
VKAIARHIRISPKKANLVAGLVRGKNAQEALDVLKFTPKKAAGILYKVVQSALANAQNNFKQKKEDLVIKEIVVNKGLTMKRSLPISRGRVHPILKHTSHITVTVGLPEEKKTEQPEAEKPKETKTSSKK